MSELNDLFTVHMLNEKGKFKARQIAHHFSDLLNALEKLCPPGRELAIVRTKLEEANYFAKRSIAAQPENQES